jgi:hypothetical protein
LPALSQFSKIKRDNPMNHGFFFRSLITTACLEFSHKWKSRFIFPRGVYDAPIGRMMFMDPAAATKVAHCEFESLLPAAPMTIAKISKAVGTKLSTRKPPKKRK